MHVNVLVEVVNHTSALVSICAVFFSSNVTVKMRVRLILGIEKCHSACNALFNKFVGDSGVGLDS